MKTLRFLTVLLLLLCLPLSAFAMDISFIGGSEIWTSNNDFVFVPLDPDRYGGDLDGYYKHYTDLSDNCFYLHISYTESSLKDNSGNDISLNFNIKNSGNEYQFRVDENTNGKVLDAFYVQSDFSGVLGGGQDIYVGIEFLNKEDKMLNNYLGFSLNVNGNIYYICNGDIKLAYGDYADSHTTTKETTTKPSTTKEATTKQTTTEVSTTKQSVTKPTTAKETTTKKEATTKFKYTHTTTIHNGKDRFSAITEKITKPKTTEGTTKFKYTGEAGTASSEKYTIGKDIIPNDNIHEENTTAPTNQVETDNDIIIPDTDNANGLSPQAKLLTAIAVILAIAGTALIARFLFAKKKSDDEDENSEEDQ